VSDLVSRRRAHLRLDVASPVAQNGLVAALFLAAAVAVAGMPPLSGFIGKLLVMEALRDQAALVWSVILGASLLIILGFARAGSTLFWKAHASGSREPATHRPEGLAFVATFGLLAGLVVLTLFSGPVLTWLEEAARLAHDGTAYIAANRLPEGN